ncbi:MAG: phosphatidylserine decarboxylase family protein [Planctomycetia bacterium]|nr:phosphatidylserine decarboxylase family protein [Planctomycetia bacterium]
MAKHNNDAFSHEPGEWPAAGGATKGMARTWSKVRRFVLSQTRRRYVEAAIAQRKGACVRCGQCCSLVWRCPYLADGNQCRIYDKRFKPCDNFPIDYWDLRWAVVPCGHKFDRPPYRRWLGVFARYGRREVAVAILLAALGIAASAIWLWPLAPVVALLLAFVLWFFRDPNRRVPEEDRCVVSPADGKVVEIARTAAPEFPGGEALKISIFMSLFSVHVNRAPVSGRVTMTRWRKGKFHVASKPKASQENERNDMLIAMDEDGELSVMVRQIAGVIAGRIVCDAEEGCRLERGERFGMIKFGSRLEVFVPADRAFEVKVREGQKVRAGVTILGVFS